MDENLVLGRYRLVERLAIGGSAEVWCARDEQLDRDVAVKRLHPHLLPDEGSRKRLTSEARAAAALSHPVVVEIYDVDPSGEWPAIVMELVEGESLAARIARDGPLPASDAAVVVADVAEALYHAHQRGVIHRDVKPGNVLLARDGRTRLVDFGIAHSLATVAERLTLTGTVVGTLHAMAPEQLLDGPIGPRTDLYGLGVVLHEALTGRPPYAASSQVALADAQRAGPPAMPGLDPALAAVIAACLANDPAERPLHAGALAAALRDWLAGDHSAALAMAPAGAPATSAITQPIPAVAVPASPEPVVWASPAPRPPSSAETARQGRWRAAAAAVAALAVLTLVAFVSSSSIGLLGGAGTSSTPSPTATPAAWLADLAAAVDEACGAAEARDFESAASDLGEQEARLAAEERIDACDGDKKGKGNGNGRGNGGPGRGGGDD